MKTSLFKTTALLLLALSLMALRAPNARAARDHLGTLWLIDVGLYLVTDITPEQKALPRSAIQLDQFNLKLQEELNDRFSVVYTRIENHENPTTLKWMQDRGPASQKLFEAYNDAYQTQHWNNL